MSRLCCIQYFEMTNYLIDITRFISRIGRGKPTGIDRVETAYILELAGRDPDCLAIAKMGKDFVVVRGQDAARAIAILDEDRNLGRDGLKDFYRLKLPRAQRRARQYFRSVALKSSKAVPALLAAFPMDGVEYVNVGHSNLSDEFLPAVSNAGCAPISVMIHDMIPLDFPEFTKAGITAQFETRMRSVARHADRVICNSADTEARVKHYFSKWHSGVETVVAHLGVEVMEAEYQPDTTAPYFVCLGTIEPRKNHAVLFKVWEKLAAELPSEKMPQLHVIGRRGWNNEDVFKFLDTSPLIGTHIFEYSDLGDDQLAKEMCHCAGLVFPSFAEGYGLPALEAAQMGVPVICSDLPVFREILGDYATFVDASDADAWAEIVRSVAKMTNKSPEEGGWAPDPCIVPRWESHFCHVFS